MILPLNDVTYHYMMILKQHPKGALMNGMQVRQWCEADTAQPVLSEVVGLLPVAIQGPTVFTVALLVTIRWDSVRVRVKG